jgi:DNA-binding PucR family transcriptional regulator
MTEIYEGHIEPSKINFAKHWRKIDERIYHDQTDKLLNTISPNLQRTIRCYFCLKPFDGYTEMTYRKAAKILNIKPNTVYYRIKKAFKLLRNLNG